MEVEINKRTRQDIENDISSATEQIKQLTDKIMHWDREATLFSDSKQWFIEKEESWTIGKGKNKKTETHLCGRIHWNQTFFNQGTNPPTPVVIERSLLVILDGEWQ